MSKKKIALLVGAALIVGVVALGGGAAYVFARESFASGDGPPIPFCGHDGFPGGHGGRHGMRGFAGGDGNPMDMLSAAAEAAGMTPEALMAELAEGKTPQEILEEHDVDWADLHEEMQEQMPEGGFGHHECGHGMDGYGGPGGNPMALLHATAEELGMTPEALMAELAEGKTPREIVEAQGLDPEQFFSDLGETFIAQAIEDGTMTQEQADWLMEGVEQGYIPKGMHHGEGGYWGPCGGEQTPSGSE